MTYQQKLETERLIIRNPKFVNETAYLHSPLRGVYDKESRLYLNITAEPLPPRDPGKEDVPPILNEVVFVKDAEENNDDQTDNEGEEKQKQSESPTRKINWDTSDFYEKAFNDLKQYENLRFILQGKREPEKDANVKPVPEKADADNFETTDAENVKPNEGDMEEIEQPEVEEPKHPEETKEPELLEDQKAKDEGVIEQETEEQVPESVQISDEQEEQQTPEDGEAEDQAEPRPPELLDTESVKEEELEKQISETEKTTDSQEEQKLLKDEEVKDQVEVKDREFLVGGGVEAQNGKEPEVEEQVTDNKQIGDIQEENGLFEGTSRVQAEVPQLLVEENGKEVQAKEADKELEEIQQVNTEEIAEDVESTPIDEKDTGQQLLQDEENQDRDKLLKTKAEHIKPEEKEISSQPIEETQTEQIQTEDPRVLASEVHEIELTETQSKEIADKKKDYEPEKDKQQNNQEITPLEGAGKAMQTSNEAVKVTEPEIPKTEVQEVEDKNEEPQLPTEQELNDVEANALKLMRKDADEGEKIHDNVKLQKTNSKQNARQPRDQKVKDEKLKIDTKETKSFEEQSRPEIQTKGRSKEEIEIKNTEAKLSKEKQEVQKLPKKREYKNQLETRDVDSVGEVERQEKGVQVQETEGKKRKIKQPEEKHVDVQEVPQSDALETKVPRTFGREERKLVEMKDHNVKAQEVEKQAEREVSKDSEPAKIMELKEPVLPAHGSDKNVEINPEDNKRQAIQMKQTGSKKQESQLPKDQKHKAQRDTKDAKELKGENNKGQKQNKIDRQRLELKEADLLPEAVRDEHFKLGVKFGHYNICTDSSEFSVDLCLCSEEKSELLTEEYVKEQLKTREAKDRFSSLGSFRKCHCPYEKQRILRKEEVGAVRDDSPSGDKSLGNNIEKEIFEKVIASVDYESLLERSDNEIAQKDASETDYKVTMKRSENTSDVNGVIFGGTEGYIISVDCSNANKKPPSLGMAEDFRGCVCKEKTSPEGIYCSKTGDGTFGKDYQKLVIVTNDYEVVLYADKPLIKSAGYKDQTYKFRE